MRIEERAAEVALPRRGSSSWASDHVVSINPALCPFLAPSPEVDTGSERMLKAKFLSCYLHDIWSLVFYIEMYD